MIYALNPTVVVRWVSFVTFVFAVAAVWLSSPTSAHSLWAAKSIVLGGPSAILFVMTFRPVFRWVHKFSFARVWLFPLLDGEWEGEVHSNWPRIQAMMEAARGNAPPFNALSDPAPTSATPGAIQIRAKIESGLLDFRITLTMSDTRHSRTIFVKPERGSGQPSRLYYIYTQQEDGALEVTDAGRHQGAAYLDYDEDTGRLSGAYWTERQGEFGLNTAGRIRLWRRGSASLRSNAV